MGISAAMAFFELDNNSVNDGACRHGFVIGQG